MTIRIITHGERIEQQTPIRDEIRERARGGVIGPGGNPLEEDLLDDAIVRRPREQLQIGARRVHERNQHAADANHADGGIRAAVCRTSSMASAPANGKSGISQMWSRK